MVLEMQLLHIIIQKLLRCQEARHLLVSGGAWLLFFLLVSELSDQVKDSHPKPDLLLSINGSGDFRVVSPLTNR